MFKTNHFFLLKDPHFINDSLDILISYVSTSAYLLKDKMKLDIETAQQVKNSFEGMGIIQNQDLLVVKDLKEKEFVAKIFPWVKFIKDEVIQNILPEYLNAIEWWNTNTNKYNQNTTEKYYPHKKWQSMTQYKVFMMYLSESNIVIEKINS